MTESKLLMKITRLIDRAANGNPDRRTVLKRRVATHFEMAHRNEQVENDKSMERAHAGVWGDDHR